MCVHNLTDTERKTSNSRKDAKNDGHYHTNIFLSFNIYEIIELIFIFSDSCPLRITNSFQRTILYTRLKMHNSYKNYITMCYSNVHS